MPAIPIHPPGESRLAGAEQSGLPQLLQTPSGLAIVEIQGTIKFSTPPSAQNDGSTAASSSIGRLEFPNYDASKPEDISWQKRVHLYVGKHQRLTGEVKKLSKPIAVLRRRAAADDRDELEIAEIVYYKLLFTHRPEPVGGGDG